ncbi:hypothetical protein CHCC20335_1336 [Bacillus paralicheniformis]|nr:hypothetical protein CHCC20335_1336 [Bacillus paralicheniformis]
MSIDEIVAIILYVSAFILPGYDHEKTTKRQKAKGYREKAHLLVR